MLFELIGNTSDFTYFWLSLLSFDKAWKNKAIWPAQPT